MIVNVIYVNGSHDMVKASRLDDLLPTGKIAKFRRANGWVTVGVDPIRATNKSVYPGMDRRKWNAKLAA